MLRAPRAPNPDATQNRARYRCPNDGPARPRRPLRGRGLGPPAANAWLTVARQTLTEYLELELSPAGTPNIFGLAGPGVTGAARPGRAGGRPPDAGAPALRLGLGGGVHRLPQGQPAVPDRGRRAARPSGAGLARGDGGGPTALGNGAPAPRGPGGSVARQHDGTTVSPVAWDRFGVFSVGVVILVAGAGSGQACRV